MPTGDLDYARWNLRAAGRKPATHPTSVQRPAGYRHGFHTRSTPIQIDDMCGTQFHPEKSGEVGLRVVQAFVEMYSSKP